MQIVINPETPGVWGAILDMENKKTITGMHSIMRESLVSDIGELVPVPQADKWLRNMSMNQTNEMTGKFSKAMEGLKTQALPPTGSGQ